MIPIDAVVDDTSEAPIVRYSVSDAQIAKLRADYQGLTIEAQGYDTVRIAIGEVRDLRVGVERRRGELKANALAYGRMVDAEAKRITGLLAEIEDPLKAQKDAVDAEKARIKQEAIDAKQREMDAQLRAEREAEEARLRAIRELEEARLADARDRLAFERRELDEARRVAEAADAERRRQDQAERAAEDVRLRAEREALETERRKVQQERERAEREEFERQAKIRAEREAAERLERERLAKLERERELEALLPDVAKVKAFATAIRTLPLPKVKSKKVATLISFASVQLTAVATDLEAKAGRL